MLVVYQKYYTPLDRLINKFRRKAFWLYTGLVTISLLYMFYEISHLPTLPPPPPPPPSSSNASRRKARQVTTKEITTTDPKTGVLKVEEVVVIE
ncbi:hypothetical protein KGF57_002408 [Candida theae]|uniref:Uncharacterized protein n=1 Tax=Candida theae TaxID=1198502 RepID=A0AAD5BF03_9ASCO|nr:uncharacterized protein KGF57_002408 [Candida theae]KAI5958563.1 hypothetical protein KGF57_002408 [Candida theae]